MTGPSRAARILLGPLFSRRRNWLDLWRDHRDATRPTDPTHGRIDRDIQDYVDGMRPTSLGQRVAIENTLQERRAASNVTRLPCPTCSGPIRETVGMVCPTCGVDYGLPSIVDAAEQAFPLDGRCRTCRAAAADGPDGYCGACR